MNSEHANLILSLARSSGLLRARDVERAGVSRSLLAQLVLDGQLHRISRGLYCLHDRPSSEHDSLAEISARSQQAVICLISALRFYELTTQHSAEVWLAFPHKSHPPKVDYPPLRIVRMSGDAMSNGIETVMVSGVTLRVFCIGKTVADCFKFRNKIGLDVALEALREAWRTKRVNMDELWRYAQICRVANVMRPYLESLGAA